MAPEGWRTVSLGETGDWLSGGTPSKRKPEFWSGGIPWVSPKDMKVLRIGSAIDEVSEAAIGNGTRLVEPGTLLLVVRGMILAHSFPVALTTRNVAFNQDIKAIVPSSSVDPEFLLYWLEAAKVDVLAQVNEATHGTKRVPTEGLQAMPVRLPPLPEQRKIAAILGSVDALIERTQAVIDQVEVVKKGLMQELLTRGLPGRHTRFKQTEIGEIPESWEVVPLSSMLETIIDYRGKTPPKSDSGIPLLSSANVNGGRIRLEKPQFISTADYSKWTTRGFTQPGDVLITTEAPAGEVAPYPPEGVYQISRRVMALRANLRRLSPRFLLYALQADVVKQRLLKRNRGSTVPRLLKPDITEMPLAIPPLEEQARIAEVLGSSEAYSMELEAELSGLASVKAAMSSALLSGEVRAQTDESDAAA
ncbi:MAG: restriction endonuclease subunit S [Myxococcota bacterium]